MSQRKLHTEKTREIAHKRLKKRNLFESKVTKPTILTRTTQQTTNLNEKQKKTKTKKQKNQKKGN